MKLLTSFQFEAFNKTVVECWALEAEIYIRKASTRRLSFGVWMCWPLTTPLSPTS